MTKAQLGGWALDKFLVAGKRTALCVATRVSPKTKFASTKNRFGGDGEALPIDCYRQTGRPYKGRL